MDPDPDPDVFVIYHSAVGSRGFSPQFCRRYAELSGEAAPGAWAGDSIRIDNATSMRVVEELGADNCGRGLTVARISRRQLPALRLLEADGCEYPDLDPARFLVHYIDEHYAQHEDLSREAFERLRAEARNLHLRVVSRAALSPVSTANRFSCLSA